MWESTRILFLFQYSEELFSLSFWTAIKKGNSGNRYRTKKWTSKNEPLHSHHSWKLSCKAEKHPIHNIRNWKIKFAFRKKELSKKGIIKIKLFIILVTNIFQSNWMGYHSILWVSYKKPETCAIWKTVESPVDFGTDQI